MVIEKGKIYEPCFKATLSFTSSDSSLNYVCELCSEIITFKNTFKTENILHRGNYDSFP